MEINHKFLLITFLAVFGPFIVYILIPWMARLTQMFNASELILAQSQERLKIDEAMFWLEKVRNSPDRTLHELYESYSTSPGSVEEILSYVKRYEPVFYAHFRRKQNTVLREQWVSVMRKVG